MGVKSAKKKINHRHRKKNQSQAIEIALFPNAFKIGQMRKITFLSFKGLGKVSPKQ